MRSLILLFFLCTTPLMAQDRAAHILLGMPIGTAGGKSADLSPKPGFAIGLDCWFSDSKGNPWSLGAMYNLFRRKNETQKETFEYFSLRAMPLVYHLDKKKQWYFEIGVFGNYLLHQEFQDGGSVMNKTKLIQRTYFGPSGGFGVRIGDEGKSRILIGLRDEFGILGLGKGAKQQFNTITLFAGLEI